MEVEMSIPETMNAVAIRAPGGADVLYISQFPTPAPATGEVLIKVAAAGVNRADIMQRQGVYPMPPGAPEEIPGLEVSGTVAAVGPAVARWKVGDEVCALLIGSGYAEYVLAPEGQCMPVPNGTSLLDAGSLPETFCTVWTNMFERGRMRPGEIVVVQGGASGIGVTAIMLAKAFGAVVVTTAGSDEKCGACRKLGADLAINYRKVDFAEAVNAFTQGHGVDLIIDIVGGDYIPRELDILKREGRLVFIAQQAGSLVEADFYKILLKHLTVTGSTLRSRTVAEKSAICAELERRVWPLFGETIRPIVHQTFHLSQAADAHRLLESSAHVGKILLLP